MLLAVDISNTGIKFGLYESREMVARWRIATVREKTADEYAMIVRSLCRQRNLDLKDIKDVIISSVVPVLTPVFQESSRTYLNIDPIVVSYKTDLGVKLLVDSPWEIGTDRIISTLATHELYGGPAIVIQFGTATSFDVVSAEGDFLGGAIAPGLGISADALTQSASKLFQVEMKAPPSALGKNTTHSMQSGIIFGHAAMVEGVIQKLRKEFPGGERAKVIAHGGLADVIVPVTDCIDEVRHNLILEGLRIAYEQLKIKR